MNEQTNGRIYVNIEALINEIRRFRDVNEVVILQDSSIRVDAPDTLTFIRSIDPTLLKDVWTARSCGKFTLYAAFGVPENNNWLVLLYAKE